MGEMEHEWEIYDEPDDDGLEGIWLDRNGRHHKISGMKTSHIQNCISMMNRNMEIYDEQGRGKWALEKLHELKVELASRTNAPRPGEKGE